MQQKWSSNADSTTASFAVGDGLTCVSAGRLLPHLTRSVAGCLRVASACMARQIGRPVR